MDVAAPAAWRFGRELDASPRPPGRRRRRARAAALTPRLAGPLCVVASSASLQTAAALATTVFAVFGLIVVAGAGVTAARDRSP
jgi:hypothetical protein